MALQPLQIINHLSTFSVISKLLALKMYEYWSCLPGPSPNLFIRFRPKSQGPAFRAATFRNSYVQQVDPGGMPSSLSEVCHHHHQSSMVETRKDVYTFAGVYAEDLKSYRPISNLTGMSQLIERMVYQQITTYLEANHLLPKFQSGFRARHSTETAVLRVLSDIPHRDGSKQHWPARPRYVSCVRHGWPWQSSPAVGVVIWNLRHSSGMVTLVPLWSDSTSLLQWWPTP